MDPGTAMMVSAGIGAGTSLLGGLMGASSSKADLGTLGAQQLSNLSSTRAAQDYMRGLQSPYLQYGNQALPLLQYLNTGMIPDYAFTADQQAQYDDLLSRKAELEALYQRHTTSAANSPENVVKHQQAAQEARMQLDQLAALEQQKNMQGIVEGMPTGTQFGPQMGQQIQDAYGNTQQGLGSWNQNAQNFFGNQQYNPYNIAAGQVDPSLNLDYAAMQNDPRYKFALDQAQKSGLTSLSKVGKDSTAGFKLLSDLGFKTALDYTQPYLAMQQQEKANQFQNIGNAMQAGLANQAEAARAFGLNYQIGTDSLNQQLANVNNNQNAFNNYLGQSNQDWSLGQGDRQSQIANLMSQLSMGANAAGISGQTNMTGANNIANTNTSLANNLANNQMQSGLAQGGYYNSALQGLGSGIQSGINAYQQAPMNAAIQNYMMNQLNGGGLGTYTPTFYNNVGGYQVASSNPYLSSMNPIGLTAGGGM